MSSYKPATYNNTTSSENSDNNQHSFQQDSLPQRDVFEPHDSRGSPHMPVAGKKAILARIEGEDDELVVIGTGINPYEPLDPKRRPIKLPNIDYGYPEASVQNFSPGTSVIFNAFKGHTSLLRRPYMASNEDSERLIEDAAHRRPQSPYSQESHFEQPPRQHSIYSSREKDSSSSYRQQHPLEHSPYRASHDRQFHPYQPNSHPRDHSDYRDYQERRGSKEYNDSREFDDPMNRHGQRSPRMSYSATNQGVSNPSQSWTERSFDHQSKMSEHHDPYRHRDDYPSQATSYSRRSPPPPPPQHKSHDPGRHMPPPSLSTIQNRRWQDNDYPNTHHQHDSYDSSNRYHPSQPQHHSQHRISAENWESSMDHNSPVPTPAIDIPLARNRSSIPFNATQHEPMDISIRNQHHQSQSQSQSQYGHASSSVGLSSIRDSLSQRPTGPRYSLTSVQYRMIFDYANEIRDCLIKGKQGTTDRLLYNAEILTKVFMGCRSDIDPNAPLEEDSQPANLNQLHCTSCNIVKTPEWRKGPLGPRTLCNACGLIWGKMSRSKAALIKSKQESAPKSDSPANNSSSKKSSVTSDVNMTDATRENRKEDDQVESTGSPNKRRRDAASTNDGDSDEASTRDEDRQAHDVSTQHVRSLQQSEQDPPQQSQAFLSKSNEKVISTTIKTEV